MAIQASASSPVNKKKRVQNSRSRPPKKSSSDSSAVMTSLLSDDADLAMLLEHGCPELASSPKKNTREGFLNRLDKMEAANKSPRQQPLLPEEEDRPLFLGSDDHTPRSMSRDDFARRMDQVDRGASKTKLSATAASEKQVLSRDGVDDLLQLLEDMPDTPPSQSASMNHAKSMGDFTRRLEAVDGSAKANKGKARSSSCSRGRRSASVDDDIYKTILEDGNDDEDDDEALFAQFRSKPTGPTSQKDFEQRMGQVEGRMIKSKSSKKKKQEAPTLVAIIENMSFLKAGGKDKKSSSGK